LRANQFKSIEENFTFNLMTALDGEVPAEILEQLENLKKAFKENKKLSADFRDKESVSNYDELDDLANGVAHHICRFKKFISNELVKNNVLSDKLSRDNVIARQITKSKDTIKNQDYVRLNSIEYMSEITNSYEKSLTEHRTTIEKLRQIIESLQRASEIEGTDISPKNLQDHIKRFDQIFSAVANQVHCIAEEIEKAKDVYLEKRGQIYGRFGIDPFEERKERKRIIDTYSKLKGIDAFPSSNAMLSLSEYLPKPSTQQLFGAAPTFGFGSKPLLSTAQTTSPFSFTLPPNSSSTTIPIYGSKQTSASSLFAPVTTTPAMNTPAGPSTATAAGSMLSFSNTLSSASSGTLFKGSAANPFAPTTKPLFGK